MAKRTIKKGSTSVSVYVFIQDSSVTTGAGLTGVVFNSAGLVAYYVRPLGSATAITLATQTVTGAYSSGGFVEVSAANMPGVYRLDLPDAVVAIGVDSVVVELKGATNMAPVTLELDLVAFDPQDVVRLGLTALPNVASGSAGAILTTGTGANQLSVSSGLVTLAGVTHTGAVIPTVSTLTGHTAQTGDAFPRLGAPVGASLSADIAGVQADTNDIQTRLPAVLVSGTADSGTTITMVDAARTEATTDHWRGTALVITSGAVGSSNIGLGRLVTGFNPATDTLTVSPAFPFAIGTDTYELWPATDAILAGIVHTGATVPTVTTTSTATNVTNVASLDVAAVADILDTALAGFTTPGTVGRALTVAATITSETIAVGTPTTTVIQLSAGSTVDNFYKDQLCIISAGTGAGQASPILSYVGATKAITLSEALEVAPVSGSGIIIRADHIHPITQIQAGLATQASVDAVDNFIDTEVADIQSRLPAALVGGRMDVSVGAMAANVLTAAATATDFVTKVLTTQMTEAYAADGVAPTLAQALMLIQQSVGDFSISGTTLTVKKLDGTTSAATYTLDSATAPTSRTRAT